MMLRLENVIKMFDRGRRALNGVSLCVEPGELVTIRGASGSGKTTLASIILGTQKPSAGRVLVHGQDIGALGENDAAKLRNLMFGVLPRKPGFLKFLPVWENVALPLAVRRVPLQQRQNIALAQLESLGIGHIADALPGQLGAMDAQLSSVARALIARPMVLLIDGAEADLTERETERLRDVLNGAWQEERFAVIRLTDRERDDWPADREFLLEYGKLMEVDT